ncbi:Gluconokinase [Aphelenchoides bicaudatus]|nr:Gluconokinase [Aphelenchoides bicaudatus]
MRFHDKITLLSFELFRFIDGDNFHSKMCVEKMSKGVGLSDDDRKEWLEMLSHFGDQTDKQVVLACSALKKKYRQVLTGDRTDEDCQILILTADRKELEQRLASRKNHYAKTSLLDSQLETLELPVDDETNVQQIDVTNTIDQVIDEIVQRLTQKRH